jgi:hypothetical protein
MFGGSVDLKYVSSIYNGDDQFDTDLGYQGRIQFAFGMTGADGHHATEMDGRGDDTPRSFPRVYNALFVGHLLGTPLSVSSDDLEPAVMRLREGTGGEFGNIIVANAGSVGVFQNECAGEDRSHTLPTSRFTDGNEDYLWFSSNNIITGPGNFYDLKSGCEGFTTAVGDEAPLRVMPGTVDFMDSVNPTTPKYLTETTEFLSPAYTYVDTVPSDDFFDSVDYKGAFGNENLWLKQWSWLSVNEKLVTEAPVVSTTSSSSGLSDSEIAGTVIGVLAALIVVSIVVGVSCYQRGQKAGRLGATDELESGSGMDAVVPSNLEMGTMSQWTATKGGNDKPRSAVTV